MAACSVCTYTIRLNEVQVNYNFFSDLMLLMNIAPLARTYTVLALRCLQRFALSQSKYSYSCHSFSAGGERNHASGSRTNKQVRENNNFCLLLFEKSKEVDQRIYFSETSFTSFCTWKGIMAIDTGLRFHTKTIVFTSWFLSYQMIFYKLFSKTHWMHFKKTQGASAQKKTIDWTIYE